MRRIVSCVLLAVLMPLACVAARAATAPLAVGAAAPPVDEPTGAGAFESSRSAKPYVLEFFAVWCPHCQREVAVLNRLQAADGDRADVIAVPASPFGFDHTTVLAPADLQAFAQRFDVRYRIGWDGYFALPYDYGVASFPTFYVVGASRRVVAVESGEVPFETLHADVAAALAAP